MLTISQMITEKQALFFILVLVLFSYNQKNRIQYEVLTNKGNFQ